jgi:hypothetical protein
MAARETANRLRGRTRAGMGSGKAPYDREHTGGAVARDKAKLNSPIKSEGSLDVRTYAADVSNSEDVRRVSIVSPGTPSIRLCTQASGSSCSTKHTVISNLYTPDEPVTPLNTVTVKTPERWGSVPRTYMHTLRGQGLFPSLEQHGSARRTSLLNETGPSCITLTRGIWRTSPSQTGSRKVFRTSPTVSKAASSCCLIVGSTRAGKSENFESGERECLVA